MKKLQILTIAAVAAIAPCPASAETLREEVARLRAENAALKKEISKLKPAEPAKGKWVRQLSAGVLLTSGNNDNFTATGGISVERQTDNDKFRSFVNGAYGESNGTRNAQFIRGGAQYNRDFTSRYYWYAGTLLEHDNVAGLDFRLGIGPGVGAHLVKTDTITLDAEGGLSYYYEEFTNRSGESSLRARAAENFTYQFSPAAKFYQKFEIAADVSDFGNFIMNNEAGIETTLNERFKLRLSFLDRYVNQPPGTLQKNDIQLTSSLVLDF
jgi:putative salt-induced outer membrane protein